MELVAATGNVPFRATTPYRAARPGRVNEAGGADAPLRLVLLRFTFLVYSVSSMT